MGLQEFSHPRAGFRIEACGAKDADEPSQPRRNLPVPLAGTEHPAEHEPAAQMEPFNPAPITRILAVSVFMTTALLFSHSSRHLQQRFPIIKFIFRVNFKLVFVESEDKPVFITIVP